MDNSDQKTQTNKLEVRHDLNNLAYLLKTLSNVLAKIPNLPNEVEKLINGAIKSTENILAKVGGSSTKASQQIHTNKNQEPSESNEVSK